MLRVGAWVGTVLCVYARSCRRTTERRRGLTAVIVSGWGVGGGVRAGGRGGRRGIIPHNAGLYHGRPAVTRHARAGLRPFKRPDSDSEWVRVERGQGWGGGAEGRWPAARGKQERGALGGEMRELRHFNGRPCLKRRAWFPDRDPSQEAQLQNRLIEVVESSCRLILHNAQAPARCE